MAVKILGQARPTTTANVDLYTVPSASEAVCSTLHINNSGATGANAKVFVRKFDGTLAAASASNEFLSGVVVTPGSPLSYTIGITLAEGDTVTVQSDVASTLTFHLFGSEN